MHCQYGRDISETNAYYLISRAGPKCIEHAAEGVPIEYERHLDGDLSLTQGLKMISTEDDSRVQNHCPSSTFEEPLYSSEWVHPLFGLQRAIDVLGAGLCGFRPTAPDG